MKFIDSYLKEANKILEDINKNQVKKVINKIAEIKKIKGRIFFLGVGGSAANASHAVNDFKKFVILNVILQPIIFPNLQPESMMMVGTNLTRIGL